MRYKEFGLDTVLSAEAVDRCSERAGEFLDSLGLERREILRLRLSLEEILLRWQTRFGESAMIHLACYLHLGQPTMQVRLVNEPFDPLADEQEETGAWGRRMMSELQSTPLYSYSKNTNIVTFKLLRQKRSPLVGLLSALILGITVGLLGVFLPQEFRLYVSEHLLAPVCSTYIGVLDFFGIPLIFLSVALGICGIGDASSFGKIGKRMIAHFMLTVLAATVAAGVLSFPFFSFTYGSGTQIAYDSLLDMLLGFLPTSVVSPFLDCNAMQLVITGTVFGIAILKLDPVASGLSGVLQDLHSLFLLVSQWITRLTALFVFIILVKSLWMGEVSEMLVAWKSWVITTGLQVLVLSFMLVQISLRCRVKIRTLLHKIFATFVVALGTNSCGATIPEIYTASERLGVNPRMMGFGIPIGTSIFKPACAVRLLILSFFMATTYHVEVSFAWFVTAVLVAILFSIAVPAIPSGAMLLYPLLFVQLGLPAEAITAMLATDIFFDATCTAFCQVSVELALVQQADLLGMLDLERLRSAA